jgi:hypothetical protein
MGLVLEMEAEGVRLIRVLVGLQLARGKVVGLVTETGVCGLSCRGVGDGDEGWLWLEVEDCRGVVWSVVIKKMKGVRRDSAKYLKHVISMHIAKENLMVKATLVTIKPNIII